ncbi:hypothetical protein D1AOALGA4SA_4730 [Olavius algarvensis Delta 1 endosymbiont]|nr:hypothetical protein D1AOALGA4SA_4730 [Olavius algarvensis Delta 1 endosymbiont]
MLGFVALNPTYICRWYYEMRNPTSTDFQIEPQKFLLFDQTGCPLAGDRRSCETT